jgi:hypothetical protein
LAIESGYDLLLEIALMHVVREDDPRSGEDESIADGVEDEQELTIVREPQPI